MNAGIPREPGRLDRCDLAFEDRVALRVFIAEIDIDLGGFDDPGGYQHPFEKTVRVGFEKIAVLEGAGLALVGVDGEQPRRRLLQHQTPFTTGRKTRPAEPTQARMLEGLDQLLGPALPHQTRTEKSITAGRAVGGEADEFRARRVCLACCNSSGDTGGAGVLVQRVGDRHDRRPMAPAHAGCPDDPDTTVELAAQIMEKLRCAGQLAAEAVAYADGQRGRWRLAVHDDVKVGVERGDLISLYEGEPHLLGKRREMTGVETAEMVLQLMEMLDQEIASALPVTEHRLHLGERRGIDLPALRVIRPAPPPRARMDAAVVRYRGWHLIAAASPSPPFRGEREGPARSAGG